jgi:hypothetical protein
MGYNTGVDPGSFVLKLLHKSLTHKLLSLDVAMREATLEISKYKRRYDL